MAGIFSPLSFDEALAETAASGRWLLVDASGEHCPPCKVMDRTTWLAPQVARWIQEHGLALQFLIEHEEVLARRLEIRAVPTVLAFHHGREIDRRIGLCSADDLLAWLDGVLAGRTVLDGLRASVKEHPSDMSERLRLAGALRDAGRLDEATAEYAWLWANMVRVEPAMVGVRGSFMLSEIQDLTRRHPAARQHFAALRDGLQGASSSEHRLDWVLLNHGLGDDDRTLQWFDSVKDDPGRRQAFAPAALHLERLLVTRERWKDFGHLYPEPAAEFEQRATLFLEQLTQFEGPSVEMREEMQASLRQLVRSMAGQFVHGLRAAGREDEARRVIACATKLDPSPEMQAALALG